MKKLVLMLLLYAPAATSESIKSFSKAKKQLYTKVFSNSGKTLYCDCGWRKKKTDLKSCSLFNYFPKKQRNRANRTEAEHIIPASWMLKVNKKLRQCAIEAKAKGENKRKYCQKHDSDYKMAHNDLVNLWPTVGQINADRSNKPFVDNVKTEKRSYGKCDAVSGSRGFVPPNHRKGDIARVAFYMSEKYGVVYSARQLKLFEEWDIQDPISIEEVEHNQRVLQVQGYGQR